MPRPKNLGLIPPPKTGPAILVFDVETAAYTIRAWDIWKVNALDIKAEWFMLCFAYAWYDYESQTIGEIGWVGLPQDTKWRPGSHDDRYVIRRLHRLFDQADILVGQNHERFDIKKANERMFIHKMDPPSNYKTVDLKRHYKKRFSGSAALKYMARKADVALKESNRGYSLWDDCENGVESAWREMESYNRADVKSTAQVYTRLLPWMGELGKGPQHPHLGHYLNLDPGERVCRNCGNRDKDKGGLGFQIRKYYATDAYRYPQLQCNKCKRYGKHYKSVPGTRTELR